jgi:hypothetical protein
MNVVPMGGIISGAAGAPLAQTSGSETERTQRDGVVRERRVTTEQSAEMAAGIGTTDEDQEASERDADGRMFWERGAEQNGNSDEATSEHSRQSKDPTGESGNSLDLTG